MKQQATPSLILERYQQTGAHRLREAEKWLFWIKEYLEIPEDKYRTLEVVFRQLLIHPKMNTAFAYQFDEPFKLSSDSKKIKSEVSSYLAKVTTKSNYGLHSLDLEKKERIKSAELFIKNEYASIKKMEEFARQIKKESSLISEKELITHIETLKLIAKEKVRSSTAALHLTEHHDVSERKAASVLGLNRSTQHRFCL